MPATARELREKTDDELKSFIVDKQNDIIQFRLQEATGVVENVRLSRNARREIARAKTILRDREMAAAKQSKKQ